MKFKKVIFFRHIPLTEKVFKDFYMDLKDELKNLEFEYWDLSSIYFKNDVLQENSSNLIFTRYFSSLKEFETQVSQQDNNTCLYLCLLSVEGRVRTLFHCFTKYDCIVGVFARNMFPTEYHSQSFFDKVKHVTFKRLKNLIQTKLLQHELKQKKVKLFSYVFQGGKMGWKSIGRISQADIKDAVVININSGDYDEYLSKVNSDRVIKEDYVLFLDEYLPLHPDTQLFGMNNVDPATYYRELNRYFSHLEKYFKKPVVIAAHPKALRYKTEDFFNKRKVFFGKTLELVKDASLVLAHDSTSINYPVAFCKKIHLLTSKSIRDSIPSVHFGVLNFAEYLGCSYEYMDDKTSGLNVSNTISIERYHKYKFDFQTSECTGDMLTRDIFKKFLTS